MKITIIFIFIASCFLTGCSTNKTYYVDFDQYPQLPITGTSKTLRGIALSRLDLKKKAIYGNYGGPGNQGGRPADEMDKLFYVHDRAYLECYTLAQLREADRELVRGLRALDESTLSPEAATYRKTAIDFFTKPISGWVGKPRDVKWGLRKKPSVLPMSEYPGPGQNPNVVKTTVIQGD